MSLVLALCCALCSCDSRVPERTLDRVAPHVVSRRSATEVSVYGSGFQPVPVVRLGSRDPVRLQSDYRVRLGDVLDTTEVTRRSSTRLTFNVPPDLPLGTYDLELTPPLGAALVLEHALTVADEPDLESLTLSLETRPDDRGERLADDQVLAAGEALELFAVFRLADGGFVTSDQPVRFSQSPVLGVLSESYAAQTVYGARLPGELTLRAESDAGQVVELSLRVEADAAQAEYRLALEDAPGGTGAALAAASVFTAGAQFECYAVVRDAQGEFVLDVPVTWSVSGAQSAPQSTAQHLQLELDKAGQTTITASHAALGDAALELTVVPGPAARISLAPDSAQLRAGDDPLVFAVGAEDAFGNATGDLGELSFSVDGSFGDLDAVSGTLTPRLAGAGHVAVTSSHGVSASTGLIEVTAGALDAISVSPDVLTLSADAQPVQFAVSGLDAFGNPTSALGDLSWSVLDGPIGTLSELGVFDPTTTGTGSIQVSSSLGPSAQTGVIEVTPGRAQSLAVAPETWSGTVGGPTQQFVASGFDADGNMTDDVGSVTFAVASGPIAQIDPASGLFTPTSEGQGTISAVSSYELTASTQTIVVSAANSTVKIVAMRAPSSLFPGATARVEVDVNNTEAGEAVVTGLGLSFAYSYASSSTGDFSVVADNTNSDHIGPGATRTLAYYVSVSPSAYTTGVSITAAGEAFLSSGVTKTLGSSTTSTVRYPLWGTWLSIDAPTPPDNGICSGGRVGFSASAASSFSYLWSLPGGTLAAGSSLSQRAPAVDYASPGTYYNTVTASYTWLFVNYATLTRGEPVYVGTAEPALVDTYPTGQVAFASPAAAASVSLASFPRSDLVALDPALAVVQCNGAPVDPTGHRALTLFSDRNLIDPAADIDPATPGIQVMLTAAGGLGSVPLVAPAKRLEGLSTLYAEYFEPNAQVVTAAGDTTFRLTGDNQAPSVEWSAPANDCGSVCLRAGSPIIFKFSEPLSTSSLSGLTVERFGGSSCSGLAANITSSTGIVYESAASALYVTPPVSSGTYAVRVGLPATITDAAAAKNALLPLSRCAIFSSQPAAAVPAVPQLTAALPAAFSPDGDQNADTLTWKLNVDAATRWVRLRITRGVDRVWAQLMPVTQAGEYVFSWGGQDPAGRILNDGAYGYSIEAFNQDGVGSGALHGFVELDSAVHLVSVWRRQ